MKSSICILIAGLLTIYGCNKKTEKSFVFDGNPLIKDKFTADPAPIVVGDTLYLFVGHDECYPDKPGFEGKYDFNITEWLCYKTADMKTWIDCGTVLKPADFKWSCGEAWASQVVERNGKFYYFVSCQQENPAGKSVGVAVSDNPCGPYKDAVGKPLITDSMTDNGTRGWWNDIDPTVFIENNQAYLCWGNVTCFLAALKDNMTELDGDISVVNLPCYIEGPWLHKHNNNYYLTYASAGKKGESISYAMSNNIDTTWDYKGEIIGNAENSFTIHPGICEFKGKHYLFYHNGVLTINGYKGATGRRSVCVSEIRYTNEGLIKLKN